jgi:hypothetical protein
MPGGFKNFVYFRTVAYHRAGKLNLAVPNINGSLPTFDVFLAKLTRLANGKGETRNLGGVIFLKFVGNKRS